MPTMTTGTQPYARRWKALMMLAASLLVVSIGNTILNLALPVDPRRSRRQLQRAAVDPRRIHAGLRRAAACRGQPRRPLRASPDPLRGSGDVRARLRLRGARARHDRADRGAGAD